jgi:hypothetical protein
MHNNFLQYRRETAQELKGTGSHVGTHIPTQTGSHVCTQIPTQTQLTL